MFLLARPQKRQFESARPRTHDAPTVGKRTQVASIVWMAPDRYKHAIEYARRELRAVRTVALPAYVKVLRRTDLAPLDRQLQLTTHALQVRHMLMSANHHVQALEKAATYRDPMVVFLRHDLEALAARAAKVGVYRGAEDMLPRAHAEDSRVVGARGETALFARKSNQTRHRVVDRRATAATSAPVR
jgi:hypothetical protein